MNLISLSDLNGNGDDSEKGGGEAEAEAEAETMEGERTDITAIKEMVGLKTMMKA